MVRIIAIIRILGLIGDMAILSASRYYIPLGSVGGREGITGIEVHPCLEGHFWCLTGRFVSNGSTIVDPSFQWFKPIKSNGEWPLYAYSLSML